MMLLFSPQIDEMEDIILLNTPFKCGKDQRTLNSSRSDFLLAQSRISGQLSAVQSITIHSLSITVMLTSPPHYRQIKYFSLRES